MLCVVATVYEKGEPMDYEHLRYERDGGFVTITLDRPERRNCLSTGVLTELHLSLIHI